MTTQGAMPQDAGVRGGVVPVVVLVFVALLHDVVDLSRGEGGEGSVRVSRSSLGASGGCIAHLDGDGAVCVAGDRWDMAGFLPGPLARRCGRVHLARSQRLDLQLHRCSVRERQ
jgi:hypothetical protein